MPCMPRRSIRGWAQWWPVRTAMPRRSRSVPMSSGCMSPTRNDSTASWLSASPTHFSSGMSDNCLRAYAVRSCSYSLMRSMPKVVR